MSFLTILLVASAFYFANARPDSQPTSETLGAPARSKVKGPEDHSISITDPKDYQHQLYALMDELSIAIDKHMTPLMSKLNKKQRDEMKNMCMNGFVSNINYVILLIQERENERIEGGQSKFFDGDFPRHEMILEFSAPERLNAPFLPSFEFDEDGEH